MTDNSIDPLAGLDFGTTREGLLDMIEGVFGWIDRHSVVTSSAKVMYTGVDSRYAEVRAQAFLAVLKPVKEAGDALLGELPAAFTTAWVRTNTPVAMSLTPETEMIGVLVLEQGLQVLQAAVEALPGAEVHPAIT